MNAPFFANWTRQIRKGLLEPALLNDIGNRGTYACEMERTLCRSHGLLMSTGAIYRMLGRLAVRICRRYDGMPAVVTFGVTTGIVYYCCIQETSNDGSASHG